MTEETVQADVGSNSAVRASPYSGFMENDERARELYRKEVASQEYAERLTQAALAYMNPERFTEGHLVQWKPLLKNEDYPDYGAPAVFVRYLSPDELSKISNGLFGQLRINEDALICYLNHDLDLVTMLCNSARLTRWSNAQTGAN